MQKDITRTTLAVLSIVGLIAASFWIIRPFVVALIWATMIVVATWSPMLSLQRRLGGHRTPAIIVMTIAMLLVFVLPLWVAISTVAEYKDEVGVWTSSLHEVKIPQPPEFIDRGTEQRLHLVFRGDVSLDEMAADIGGRLGAGHGIEVRANDMRSFGGEPVRCREPDAAAGAGDDGDAVAQLHRRHGGAAAVPKPSTPSSRRPQRIARTSCR